jgi:hypothetical protein
MEKEIEFYTAKLAKEKGFESHIAYFERAYGSDGVRLSCVEIAQAPNKHKKAGYQIVSQSRLQTWLREEHGIQVYAYSSTLVGTKLTEKLKRWGDYIFMIKELDGGGYSCNNARDQEYQTYEEALEAGLYLALEKI